MHQSITSLLLLTIPFLSIAFQIQRTTSFLPHETVRNIQTTTQLAARPREAKTSRLTRKYVPDRSDPWQTQLNPILADMMKLIITEADGMDDILTEYKDTFLFPFQDEFDVALDEEDIFEMGMNREERLDSYKKYMEAKIEETDSKILKKLWGSTLDFILEETKS
mmetsp:Transcript_9048/g.11117  ORF Transcript_9048/g.11117 Transcript_9048/m.11117 type:complete len:165 (-) Transcript_9048:113-607(-)